MLKHPARPCSACSRPSLRRRSPRCPPARRRSSERLLLSRRSLSLAQTILCTANCHQAASRKRLRPWSSSTSSKRTSRASTPSSTRSWRVGSRCDTLLNRRGWYIDKEWILACAAEHPSERPSYWTNILGGNDGPTKTQRQGRDWIPAFAGMTERRGNEQLTPYRRFSSTKPITQTVTINGKRPCDYRCER